MITEIRLTSEYNKASNVAIEKLLAKQNRMNYISSTVLATLPI